MATTKKDLYVGTDKHRWWKEAVVYQVRSPKLQYFLAVLEIHLEKYWAITIKSQFHTKKPHVLDVSAGMAFVPVDFPITETDTPLNW